MAEEFNQKFSLITGCKGYVSKPDITNTDKEYLVSGSQNVLVNDQEKVETRPGFELFGAASTDRNKIKSECDWKTSSGIEHFLREANGTLQYYSLVSSAFETLLTGLSATYPCRFDKVWNGTELIDVLLFVNHSSSLYEWSGAVTTYASASTTATVGEAGDASNQVASWVINGATSSNTNGFLLYWKLTDSGGTRTIDIYKDTAGSLLVATGSRVGDGSVTLTASGGSGITGSVAVTYTGDDTTVSANILTLTFTITKEGSTPFATPTATEPGVRFLTTGTRQIRVKDDGGTWRTFTYTGGESTTTLTGLTTNPAEYLFTAGALLVQEVRTNANTPASGFTNDTIKVLENQVYFGSSLQRVIYGSKSTSYVDVTFSTPRVPTEGFKLTMDDVTTAFELGDTPEGRQAMIVFSGKDRIYRTEFILTAGSAGDRETVRVKPISVCSGQGAISQELVTKLKSSIIFVNNDNELVELGSIENVNTIQQVPISDPIKPDFLAASFTNGALKFWRNNLYVSSTGITFILAFKVQSDGTVRKFWQPPQILPFGLFTEYGGNLYGHSSSVTETYLAFTGVNDNSRPIAFKAHFAYVNGGSREKLKNFNHYFSELYLSSNSTVKQRLIYEYKGSKSIYEYEYDGSEVAFLFVPNVNASLGVSSLGTSPLGSSLVEGDDMNKYRRFKKVVPVDHFEYQVQYECDEQDARFQILCHGSNLQLSTNAPVKVSS